MDSVASTRTAAIMIQENWDASVPTDVVDFLRKLIPPGVWLHDQATESPDPGHADDRASRVDPWGANGQGRPMQAHDQLVIGGGDWVAPSRIFRSGLASRCRRMPAIERL